VNKTRKLKGLIFDVDGTLVDSNDLHAEAWQRAFRHFGKDIDYNVVRSQIGKGGDLLVPDLLNAREMRKFGDDLREYRKKLFMKEYLDRVPPFAGASDALHQLAEMGIGIALASSAENKEVDHHVKSLELEDILAAQTSKSDAEMSKPSPEIFEAAVERLGLEPESIFVVGDTPYDILAAHRCALPIVAVRSGKFPDERLHKAEFLFADVSELVERIDEVDAWFSS
jgi:HAD superfamily hydrolase (TIGR01493 family)